MQNFEGITKTVKVFLKKPYAIIDKKKTLVSSMNTQSSIRYSCITVPENYFIVNRVLTTGC